MSLAYAITAHKCQGETLDIVIIDFGPDIIRKIRNYICPGSFYVALTRVRDGCKVFLRSFDKSYIKVNKAIEEKIDAMIKFRSYSFKKIYLDEKIFEVDEKEIKVGYLNINGLIEGNHSTYLNSDHNLRNLDILMLAETKLLQTYETDNLKKDLDNWIIIGRYDSEDLLKHMGLLLLSSKRSKISEQIQSITHQTTKRNENLQIQGLIVRLLNGLKFGFIYCRSTPNNPEIKAINKSFDECIVIMGDFNLSHRSEKDQEKLNVLCQAKKFSALAEITRPISNNQLDYILIYNPLKDNFFVTSYNNFISDHKTIICRIGLDENEILDSIKQRIFFDKETHLKPRKSDDANIRLNISINDENSDSRSMRSDSSDQSLDEFNINIDINDEEESDHSDKIPNYEATSPSFGRKFKNLDLATCWLNSCL